MRAFFGIAISLSLMSLVTLTGCTGSPAPDPVLAVSPASVDIGPDQHHSFVLISNTGGGTLDFSTSLGEKTASGGWLQVAPATGSISGGSTQTLVLSVDRSDLAAGQYYATVLVSAGDQEQVVQVNMISGEPLLEVGPSNNVDFGAVSSSETLLLKNAGTTNLLYDITLPGPWLSADIPLLGSLQPGSSVTTTLSLDRTLVPWYGQGSDTLLVAHAGEGGAPGLAQVEVLVQIDPVCEEADDCARPGHYCDLDAGLCRPLAAEGETCTDPISCASGQCMDGLCCLTKCEGACVTCAGTGTEGTCTPVANGSKCDDQNPCTANDLCKDGTCTQGNPMDCSHLDSDCSLGQCDAESGDCVAVPNEGGCVIDGDCHGTGQPHPEIECLVCRPDVTADEWSIAAGACLVEEICYVAGDQVENSCSVCDPASPTEPTPLEDGTECSKDNDPCSKHECQAGLCVYIPLLDQPCDDQDLCTTNDVCGEDGCSGTPYECGDGIDCTTDSCDGQGGCDNPADSGFCLIDGICYVDGDAPPGGELCKMCLPDKSQSIFSDSPTGSLCDDGDSCTLLDYCNKGSCSGLAMPCDDGLTCTEGLCEAGLCLFTIVEEYCLVGGGCYAPMDAQPGNPCGGCAPSVSPTEWSALNQGAPCDDSLYCTVDDQCNDGVCTGGPRDCGEQECIEAWCLEQDQECVLITMADDTPCDDGNACTLNGLCKEGVCTGVPKDCSEATGGNTCMEAKCVPDSKPEPGKCVTTIMPKGTPCDDGLGCTAETTCQTAATCGGGYPLDGGICNGLLENENSCLAASCVEPEGCLLENVPDNESCPISNGQGSCLAGSCQLAACDEGFAECNLDLSDGCETDILSSLNDCGECDTPCKYDNAWTQCAEGECKFIGCAIGFTDCDSDPLTGCEAATGSDADNCGSCGVVCESPNPAKVGICIGGSCAYQVCPVAMWNLDGEPGNGCECVVSGEETCNGIDDNCNGQLDEGFNLLADMSNCGQCGQECIAGSHVAEVSCIQGQCLVVECEDDFLDQNSAADDGCEVEVLFAGEIWVDAANSGDQAQDGSQDHPFDTIGEAVEAAEEQFMIHIAAGTYYESVTVNKAELILRGDSVDSVVIDAGDAQDAILVSANDVKLLAFTATGSQYGIHFKGSAEEMLTGGTVSKVDITQLDALADAGQWAAGVFVEYATGVTMSGLEVTQVNAGSGISSDSKYGEDGGSAAGVLLSNSQSCIVTSSLLAHIQGGPGGLGSKAKTSGEGGVAAGVYLSSSSSCAVYGNTIDAVTGGFGGSSKELVVGGAGGEAAGVYVTGSVDNIFAGNLITGLFGGAGSYAEGTEPDRAGRDQQAFGVYLQPDSYDNTVKLTNTLEGEPIAYLYGEEDVTLSGLALLEQSNPTNLGKIVVMNSVNVSIRDNTVKYFVAASGGSGKSQQPGDPGEDGTGILVKDCTGCTVADNTVTNITGGEGGTVGHNSWHVSTAGPGGSAAAFRVDGGQNVTVKRNRALDIGGGAGGPAELDYVGIGGDAWGFRFNDSLNATMTHSLAANIAGGPGHSDCEAVAACYRLFDMPASTISHLTCHNVGDACSVGHGVSINTSLSNPVDVRNSIISGATGNCLISESLKPGLLAGNYTTLHDCAEGQAANAQISWTCIGSDPKFLNPAGLDFHVGSTSPCIDAGTPTDNCNAEPAPNGCAINMGFYGNTEEASHSLGAGNCEMCPP